jgi:uncharacterized coiled-coil DUF342 family protein
MNGVELNNKSDSINNKLDSINNKLDEIISILNKDVTKNTKKMSDHIDFIENVYENVKSPLGFICSRIKYYIGTKKYTLSDKSDCSKLKLN